MSEIKELADKIADLRKCFQNIIENKENLLDPEIIMASQMLDAILTEYEKIIKKAKAE